MNKCVRNVLLVEKCENNCIKIDKEFEKLNREFIYIMSVSDINEYEKYVEIFSEVAFVDYELRSSTKFLSILNDLKDRNIPTILLVSKYDENLITDNLKDIVSGFLIKTNFKRIANYNNLLFPVMEWKKNSSDFILVNYNNAAKELIGNKKQDIIGNVSSKIFINDYELISNFEQCLFQKKVITNDNIKLFSDNRIFNIRYIYLDDERVLAVIHDVTNNIMPENKFKQSQKDLEDTLNCISLLVKNNEKIEELVSKSKAYSNDLIELPKLAANDNVVKKVNPPINEIKKESKPDSVYINNRTFNNSNVVSYHEQNEHKTELYTVDRIGELSNLNTNLLEELNQKIKIEKDIKKSESFFKEMFYKNKSIMLLAENNEKGQIIDINDQAISFYGYSSNELKQLSLEELNASTKIEIDKENIKATKEKRDFIYCKHKLKSGEIKDIEFRSSTINHDNDTLLLCVIHDITPRKIIEAKLLDAKEQAERANKLKDEFLAHISHEIRTPLSRITLNSAFLLKDSQISENNHERVKNINNSVNGALQIINEIIDISQIESGRMDIKLKPFNLKLLIYGIIEEFKDYIKHKDIKIKQDVKITKVLSDSKRIKQVLTNLISNAVKYTEEGEIKISVDKIENKIIFSVQDTGEGIRKNNLDKVFEPFFRERKSKYKAKGLGLGLDICRKVVSHLGGEISVESKKSKGSKFTFTIPYLNI